MEKEIKNKQEDRTQTAIYQQVSYIGRWRAITLFGFLIFILILKRIFHLDISEQIVFLVFGIFLLFFVFIYFIQRAKTLVAIENAYIVISLGDILFITLIIHYIGGIEWIGVMLYIIPIIETTTVLSFKKGFIITLVAAVSFISLVFLEYIGIIPHRAFFITGPELYRNIFYILFTLLTAVFVVFFLISHASSRFSKLYQKQAENLGRAKRELEASKATLEVRVRAKTKALSELAKGLEAKVKERTNELEREKKELAKKVAELERFYKVVVGRELKIRELKREMEKIKKVKKS